MTMSTFFFPCWAGRLAGNIRSKDGAAAFAENAPASLRKSRRLKMLLTYCSPLQVANDQDNQAQKVEDEIKTCQEREPVDSGLQETKKNGVPQNQQCDGHDRQENSSDCNNIES